MGDDEPPCYTRYRNHLAHLKAHLAGHEGVEEVSIPPTESKLWTADENDRFFHALRIYSRLRPDLISNAVATKSATDVCVYLDLLEKASSNLESEWSRADYDIALEVSDRWVQNEENQASFIRDSELRWEDASGNKEALDAAPLSGKDIPDDPKALELVRRRRNALQILSIAHLNVLDNIYREVDDYSVAVSDKPVHPETAANEFPLPASPSGQATMNVVTASPSLVDTRTVVASSASLPCGNDPANNEESQVPAPLSPASRRRLRKRLYMRRKRAEASGSEIKTDTPVLPRGRPKGAANKAESRVEEDVVQRNNDESVEVEAQSSMVEDVEVTKRRRSGPSGKKKFYKIKEELQELGIDQLNVHDEGLGLFHLSSIGHLMKLYQAAYAPLDQENWSISIETVQLFHTIVTDTVTEILYRTIILKEQEARLKGQSKAWRAPGDVGREHVEKALSIMGLPSNIKSAFESMIGESTNSESLQDDPLSAEDMDIDDCRCDDNESESTSDTDSVAETHFTPSLHSELNLALIRLAFCSSTESLLPMETDDDEYMKELDEEEELDERDQTLEREYEAKLWKHPGKQ